MSDHPMSPIARADFDRAHETLVSAFRSDPVHRWLYPDDAQYAEFFPQHVGAYDDGSRRTNTFWQLGDFAAVAAWVPPGAEVNRELVGKVLMESVGEDRRDETFSVLEQLADRQPTFPHWYLAWFGVRVEDQNRGLGGQLLEQTLALVDSARLPAFLEARNPRTVPFFERHGFVVTGRTEAPNVPPLASMLREAR